MNYNKIIVVVYHDAGRVWLWLFDVSAQTVPRAKPVLDVRF